MQRILCFWFMKELSLSRVKDNKYSSVDCVMSTYAEPLDQENELDLKVGATEGIYERHTMVKVATKEGYTGSSAREEKLTRKNLGSAKLSFYWVQ